MVLDSLLAGVMLFSSFAARTPNAQPNPDDYEVSIGISNDNFYLNRQWERELGEFYIDDLFWYKYDNGIYHYPLQGGKNRFHPTQKSLPLFEDIIKKHSNEGDVVLDTFLGGGTTAFACKKTNRNFKGCDVSKEYYDKVIELLK